MIARFLADAADLIWSVPVVGLCLLGAVLFTVQLGFIQIRGFPHALALLTGRYDRDDEAGTLSHFQALMSALSGTIGIGNIGGVAIAIAMGGPGAVLWMWVLGLFAMATKFVECTLATHYRDIEPETGEPRGGPMYYIERGMGPRFRPLARFYAVTVAIAGFGFACMFQSNQAASALRSGLGVPTWLTGLAIVLLGGLTIIGGIKRIGATAGRLVPAMCCIYLLGAGVVCALHLDQIPGVLGLIVQDGMTGRAVLGGSVTAVILAGVRRAVFSNEAGLGSAGMAHAAVKTDHPVREGVVASLGPFIDTIVVSTATAMVILISGAYGPDADATVAPLYEGAAVELDRSGDWSIPLDGTALRDGEGLRLDLTLDAGVASVRVDDAAGDAVVAGTLGLVADATAPRLRGCELADTTRRRCVLAPADAGALQGQEGLRLVISPRSEDTRLTVYGIESVRSVKGIDLTASAFEADLPGFGSWFIPIAGFFFALSTMVTWSYYGETATVYLMGRRGVQTYRVIFVGLGFVGATQQLGPVISFSDAMVGLLVIPNFIALVSMSGRVRVWTREYFQALRDGEFDRPPQRNEPATPPSGGRDT